MNPKVKGLFKGLKYISQMFVYKEQEMEIGHPTDVRHVAHIGFDSESTHAPSWMSQFKSASDITPASLNGLNSVSIGDFGPSKVASWSSQDFKQPRRWQSVSSAGNHIDSSHPEMPKPSKKKKKKRKKVKVSSPATSSIPSSRSSFSTAYEEPVGTPNRLPATYEEQQPEMPSRLRPIISEPLCV